MRGISSIVAIVMLVAIAVGISGFAAIFFSGFLSSFSSQGDSQVENTTEKLSSCLRIEDFNPLTRNITIRNCGQTNVSNTTIIMDGSILYTYPRNMFPNEIADINLNVPIGEHTLFAVTGDAESRKMLVEVRDTCDGSQPPANGDWIVDIYTYCTCPRNGNITVNGNIYVLGDSLLNVNGCLIYINQSSNYQYGSPIVRFYGSSRVNIINSGMDSQRLFDVSLDDSSRTYTDMTSFSSRSTINSLGASSLTSVDSRFNALSITGGSPELIFTDSYITTWSNTGGIGNLRGNLTMSSVSWTGGRVIKGLSVVVVNSTNHPITAIVNVTRVGGGLVWGPQGTVDGFIEPTLVFDSTNYSASDLRVYASNGARTTSSSFNFRTTTPIVLTL